MDAIKLGHNPYLPYTKAMKTVKSRVVYAIAVVVLAFSSLIVKLAQVTIFSAHEKSKDKTEYALPTAVTKANILDRHNWIIATSLPTVSIYVCPHEIIDPSEAAEKLSSVFPEIKKEDLESKLRSKKKFLWIKRNLSPTQEQEILNQGIPGLHFLKTEKRVYPDKNLFSHIIGGTDIDNVGIAGIEKVFDEAMSASNAPIKLSLDLKVQHALRDELQKSVNMFNAIAGAAIIMEISTGEIIAMVSLPDFDPNKSTDAAAKEKFNMATSSAIEPGSSAKIFNTAMALESGKMTPFTKFDARYPLKIGRFTVHDFKGKEAFLSVEEILKYSSNIGSARIALEVGIPFQKKFYKHIGILSTITCELMESQKPLYPKSWGEASAITISYGHGFAISPLHMITVFAGILNDGVLNSPTLLKRGATVPGKRIISSKTSKQMCALLRLNVLEGSNKQADVQGYFVGGKTGTAEKQKRGIYVKNANYTSFVGAFPMTNPKYAVYIILDEPQSTQKTHGYKTAGWNAAPTFANIVRRIAPIIGDPPSEEDEHNWKEILKNIR